MDKAKLEWMPWDWLLLLNTGAFIGGAVFGFAMTYLFNVDFNVAYGVLANVMAWVVGFLAVTGLALLFITVKAGNQKIMDRELGSHDDMKPRWLQ